MGIKKHLESINKSTWGRWEVKSIYHSYGFFDGKDVDGSTITKLLYKIGLDNIDFKTVEKIISNAIKGRDLEDVDGLSILIGTTYDNVDVEVVGRVAYSAELTQLVGDVGTVLIYFDVGDVSTKEQWAFGFKIEVTTDINSNIDTDLVESAKKHRKSIKESKASNYVNNIEYIVDTLLSNKCKDCNITFDFDGEDCYIDIKQTNGTTKNNSVWSFDIDFGSCKVYMLEPRSKYLDDFDMDNINGDVLSIIK